ncbi:MAG: 50S ribosomal protein L3 [Candidatus Melainabacteria bacterium RIFCSPLOWO2_02_FULL_35_15]|nr:MAG: 50S ribosomal protein L3 [Candidatus Melainabacteria bacterium RIFCSPLOWO2_12_FULL_35_11]OGI12867.1 MAG: 50S ribosomal protein L3 [Candidatus Melainabacteria bacterium RIFCSPLOWO2_02_FULL_35_15]
MTQLSRFRIEILGKKLGMTQFFNQDGDAVPVTVIELAENIITDIKIPVRDGYSAVQIGANVKKDKHLNKPKLGNLKKKNLPNLSYLKEFRVKPEELDSYKVGQVLDHSKIIVLKEKVDVSGISIGKGFQGMVKLHNKHRGPETHGSKSHRLPGSIGAHTFPGRVLPGKNMPSRMGNEEVTVRNLEVIDFDKEKNLLLVKGAVPGAEGTMLIIKPSIKKWNVA